MTMQNVLHVLQAFDRAVFAEVREDGPAELEAKLALATKAFQDRDGWLKAHQRIAILQRTANLLESRQGGFARLIAQEGGKPIKDAAVEVIRAIDGLKNAAEQLRNFAGREIPMGITPASEGRWAFTTKEPIGVVAAISAFNHPLNLIVHQVAPAVAVGCPVIVKPAAATPLSCLELIGLLREAGLDESWCQTLITSDNRLAESLATDSRIAFLSFIGSAGVGWHLRGRLSAGTRCALEHGGAAPVIVDRSADLVRVIEPIVKGGYYHAGQVCVSVQRIFVHSESFAEFIDRLSARVSALKVGDPLLQDTDVGPLIHPRETDRVLSWVSEAAAGGTRVIGSGRISPTTLAPSILLNPPQDARVSQSEIFGPVTCVYGFDDLDDAIQAANSIPYAFQASIFSSDLAPALRAAQRLDASAVLINDHTAFRADWMPFAGRRQSGYGVGGIPYSMTEMSQEKMILLRHDD
jgi:acyl-CoA reductase-like NAD-dependent aldehyde dehydrogenase